MRRNERAAEITHPPRTVEEDKDIFELGRGRVVAVQVHTNLFPRDTNCQPQAGHRVCAAGEYMVAIGEISSTPRHKTLETCLGHGMKNKMPKGRISQEGCLPGEATKMH